MELVVLSKLKNWYFGGVMLSYDLMISYSQVIDQGPSALLFLYWRLITEVIGMAFFCQSICQSVSLPVH